MAPPVAVTFDYWETLCTASPGSLVAHRVALATEALTGAGFDADPALVEIAFEAAWPAYEARWRANAGTYTAADAAELVADRLAELLPETAPLRRIVVDAYVASTETAELELVEGVADVLGLLGTRGVAIGIVCDVGLIPSRRLRAELERHGVIGWFAHWSFSDEVGVYKPDPRIFEHALSGLGGVDPTRAAHVGDRRRTDVAGALGMGMRAVRFAGVRDEDDDAEGPEAHAVVHRHADLPAALGY